MSAGHLVAIYDRLQLGVLERDPKGRLSFRYDTDWRHSALAFPLSLSLPLDRESHGHEAIENFLWGLLPDNERIIGRWAQRFQVSARNVFGLLMHVGEDCAGGVQFTQPGRLASLLSQRGLEVQWITEQEVAERLRILRTDITAWRLARDTGQFSLAGAQPKTALLFGDGRWGIPSGRTPTTHILKPPIADLEGHAENEHFCLVLARAVGLPGAISSVRHFEDQTAIVVERFDRVMRGTEILRVHQEDMCQALGLHPGAKYQSEGGPGSADIFGLLRTHSTHRDADVWSFLDALAFNWLIAGTDAHAKNYAVLHGSRQQVRLAPLYDVASVLPYDDMDGGRLKLAMKIGGKYKLRDIVARHWRKVGVEAGLSEDAVVERILLLAAAVQDAVPRVEERMGVDGISHPIIGRLAERLRLRAGECLRLLSST